MASVAVVVAASAWWPCGSPLLPRRYHANRERPQGHELSGMRLSGHLTAWASPARPWASLCYSRSCTGQNRHSSQHLRLRWHSPGPAVGILLARRSTVATNPARWRTHRAHRTAASAAKPQRASAPDCGRSTRLLWSHHHTSLEAPTPRCKLQFALKERYGEVFGVISGLRAEKPDHRHRRPLLR